MMINCSECKNFLNEGIYIKNECCKSFLRKQYNSIFRKEKRDILAKALPDRYRIIEPLFDDVLASHFLVMDDESRKSKLLLDINPSIYEDSELGMILFTEFAHYLSKLDDNFLSYLGYKIQESHILLIFDCPGDCRPVNAIASQTSSITLVNRIISKALKAVSLSNILIPDQFSAFEILNPKRIFVNTAGDIYFLFPLFHRKFLKYAQYDDLSNQLNIFETLMENNPSCLKNKNNLLEIFNIGWNLYSLITGKSPEFDRILESKDSFPLRPARINGSCTDYLEEIILRSLMYPGAVPFASISEIYSFLSNIYKYRTMVKTTLDNKSAMVLLAKFYEEVSQFSPKKNRWIGQAYDIYHKLSSREPSNLEYIYQKASIMYKTKKFTYAKSLLLSIISRDPGHVQAHLLMGYVCLEGFNDTENAMKSYEKILSLLDNPPKAIMMLKGDILQKLGNIKEARDVFLQVFNSEGTSNILKQKAKMKLANIAV